MRSRALVGVAAGVAVIAGCGSQDERSSAGSGSATGSAVANSDVGQAEAVRLGLAYTGGRAGKADPSKPTIKIGWANSNSGTPAFPQVTHASKVAIRFVNDYLGGIDGHPLELVQPKTCDLTNSDGGTLCGQALLNDRSIKAISIGQLNVGEPELFAVTGNNTRVPAISALGTTNPGNFSLPAYFFLTSVINSTARDEFWKDVVKAKTLAQISGSMFPATYTKAEMARLGISFTAAVIPANSSDVTAPLLAAKATTNDGLDINLTTTAECIAVAKALKQLNAKPKAVAALPTCFTPDVKKAFGDYPRWTTASTFKQPYIDDPTNQAGAMTFAAKRYLGSAWSTEQYTDGTVAAFSAIMTWAKVMNQVGADNLSFQTLSDAIRRFQGPLWMGPDKVRFGTPATPSVGSFQGLFARWEGEKVGWRYVTPFIGRYKP